MDVFKAFERYHDIEPKEDWEQESMCEFLDGTELAQRLGDELRRSRTAKLAVAYWGRGAVETLKIEPGMKVQVVCNLKSGGTNPEALRDLLDAGVEVKQLDGLHSKIGVVGDIAWVGSSNMSTNGLGSEKQAASWKEFNAVFEKNSKSQYDPIANKFDHYWNHGKTIAKNDLVKAQEAWKRLRRFDASHYGRESSLLDVLRNNPEDLAEHNVRILGVEFPQGDDAEILNAAALRAEDEYGAKATSYVNWDSLRSEAEAYLLEFYWEGDVLKSGKLYERDTNKVKDSGSDLRVFRQEMIKGIEVTCEDRRVLRDALEKYVKANASEDRKERVYNVPIGELIPYLP